MKYLSRNNIVARWGSAFLGPHMLTSIRTLPHYLSEWVQYKQAARPDGQQLRWKDSHPCLSDRRADTPFDAHYFFQAAWLARRLQDTKPMLHVDIGSSAMMINVLSAATRTVFVDYRPLRAHLSNLSSLAGDIVRLPFRNGVVGSLSCLHVIEHIGLGRYGDPINPMGSRIAAAELERVLQPGGRLYASVPVGRERVCFNAHQVFAPGTVPTFFKRLDLVSFSLIDDEGRWLERASPESGDGLEYGCGLFEFVKPRA